jgi:glycosyltransferase involved in cell wall biosynthesis
MGGAERVHLDIVKAVKDEKICMLFTSKSEDHFLNDFKKCGKVIKASFISHIPQIWINKSLTKMMNKNKSLKIIFNGDSSYFYALLDYIPENVLKIDLIHAFYSEERFDLLRSKEIASKITKRIFINQLIANELIESYRKENLEQLIENINVIENGVPVNKKIYKENKELNIGFVGRWSIEKRPELYLEIAKKVNSIDSSIVFHFVGNNSIVNSEKLNQYNIKDHGQLDEADLSIFYDSLDILIVTSEREGFPMTIMEAMAHSVVPVSTEVGGISFHLKNGINGFLIKSDENSSRIINDFTEQILILNRNHELLHLLSEKAYEYASNNFDIRYFNEKYKTLLSC